MFLNQAIALRGCFKQSDRVNGDALSPQCGFSSTMHGNDIAVEAQRAKLRLVIETAQEVWGST